MRAVLVLALVALASASVSFPPLTSFKTRSVDPVVVQHQYKILELFEAVFDENTAAGYYKVGKEYDIKAHPEFYLEKGVFQHFFKLYEKGFLTPYRPFSIFDEKSRVQAMAFYDLLYQAKDFDVFYKTAAWARVHLNREMFAYTFYVATIHRADTKDLVLPALYEIWPQYFVNYKVLQEMFVTKMHGKIESDWNEYGIYQSESDKYYTYYANYSDYYHYGEGEHKISYLTEDIGWNSYYSYFHALVPFWQKGDNIAFGLFKERRGEVYYFFYQQLLARYYLERLTNGLGEIPKFSWNQPFYYGYRPQLATKFHSFAQRPENYVLQSESYLEDLRFVRNFEDMFLTYLEEGKFHAFNQDVDFYNTSSINFVGNFWQTNPDLYEKYGKKHFYESYEMAARRILGGAPHKNEHHEYFVPTALDFYQTSLRDPAFYQIYSKIMYFIMQYKKFYTQPYSYEKLHFVGVKVRDVEVSKLTTFFEFYPFNVTNAVTHSNKELSSESYSYVVVQPRLNHVPFNVKIGLKSDYEGSATFKIFLGPKYDSVGNVIPIEDNWMNFIELDWFTQHISKGDVIVERSSTQFFHFKEDSLHISGLYDLLREGKLPVDMVENYDNVPRRLMLPRGTAGGYPFQLFVVVYPGTELPKKYEPLRAFIVDDLPLGYPFDRPVAYNFFQPNMYMKDVNIYHKGSLFSDTYSVKQNK